MNVRYFIFLLCFTVFSVSVYGQDTRQPAVAGTFYPDDKKELEQVLNSLIENTPEHQIDGDIRGLMVPHAGYRFSAETAAAGYSTVKNKTFDYIIVMAPSHRDPFYGATIYPGNAYQTPLGKIIIQNKVANKLVKDCSQIKFSTLGHRNEHAIEVQLPFIQKLFPGTPIIPMVVGGYDWKICKSIGNSIVKVCKDDNVLIIASTDLYHGESYTDCKITNEKTLTQVLNLQPQKLCDGLMSNNFQACGGAPVVIMQVALMQLGVNKAELIARTNSNDVMGQIGGYVVGYGALVLYKPGNDKIEYPEISVETRNELLKIARKAITDYLNTRELSEFFPVNKEMQENRGVFVTLTINGRLRGCIGNHESDIPLYELVPRMAVAAAFGDPRFAPLEKFELDKIHIKISVYLSNVYKIDSLNEFIMGKHGIIMKKDGKGATYLPEVPFEAGWKSVDEEMSSLCRKAGLPQDAWKNGAEFWIYNTQVFGEE